MAEGVVLELGLEVGMPRRRSPEGYALPAESPAPAARLKSTTVLLYRGRVGHRVRVLQQALRILGFLKPAAMATGPGVYGPRTEAAVLAFQRAHQLAPSGKVGPSTARALTDTMAKLRRAQRAEAKRQAALRFAEGRRRIAPFDGAAPAPATTDPRAFMPLEAPVRSSPETRSAARYEEVINQFAVGQNPRYVPRDKKTFAVTFACDVTEAMGVELPYANSPTALHTWMAAVGVARGWKRTDEARAMAFANAGRPALAFFAQRGEGHVAVVRPGARSEQGPKIAQAGAKPFNEGRAAQALGGAAPEYWVHA